MSFFDTSFWQSFFSNLLATLIGVGLGIPVALWINKQLETKTEKAKNRKILELLKKELVCNLDIIYMREDEAWDIDDINQVIYLTSGIKDEVYQGLSDSGELHWIKDLELIETISDAYYEIRQVKFRANLYLELLKSNRENAFESRLYNRIKAVVELSPESLKSALHDAVDAIDVQLKAKR